MRFFVVCRPLIRMGREREKSFMSCNHNKLSLHVDQQQPAGNFMYEALSTSITHTHITHRSVNRVSDIRDNGEKGAEGVGFFDFLMFSDDSAKRDSNLIIAMFGSSIVQVSERKKNQYL